MKFTLTFIFALLLATVALCQREITVQKYNIKPKSLSVSGISAGGYMSVQFEVAFSNSVKGAGVVAGGPYWCAQSQMLNALQACMKTPSSISLSPLKSQAQSYAKQGLIDPLENLLKHKIYLYSGSKDTVVVPGVMKKLLEQYTDTFNVPKENIVTNFDTASEHAMITDDFGNRCDYAGSPYINNCKLDVSNEILRTIYFEDYTQNATAAAIDSNLFYYKQTGSYSAPSFDSKGYIYVPTACQQGTQCKVHVAFHGCVQGVSSIGLDYVKNAGYNKHAESNNLIVVYPQATTSYFNPLNPNGCFDWWGYDQALPINPSVYATKQGKQIAAIAALLKALGVDLN
ncbi:hypothetical protein ABK040_002921 [Willaertia magna]